MSAIDRSRTTTPKRSRRQRSPSPYQMKETSFFKVSEITRSFAKLLIDNEDYDVTIDGLTRASIKEVLQKLAGIRNSQSEDSIELVPGLTFQWLVDAYITKCREHGSVARLLNTTDNRIIVYCDSSDRILSCGLDLTDEGVENPARWKGLNLLGLALMQVCAMTKEEWKAEDLDSTGIYKILQNVRPNSNLPIVSDVVKVCGAFYNCYFNRLASDNDYQMEIVTDMLRLEDKENKLADIVTSTMNRNRVNFSTVTMEGVSSYLPELDMNDLYIFSKGTYQLKYCATYFADATRRLHPDGFEYEIHQDSNLINLDSLFNDVDEPILLRTKIPSYHSEHKIYLCYILVDLNKTGLERIVEHYCPCAAGKRTMGSCSHVLTMLWFGTVGFRSSPVAPAKHLENFARRINNRQSDSDSTGSDPDA